MAEAVHAIARVPRRARLSCARPPAPLPSRAAERDYEALIHYHFPLAQVSDGEGGGEEAPAAVPPQPRELGGGGKGRRGKVAGSKGEEGSL